MDFLTPDVRELKQVTRDFDFTTKEVVPVAQKLHNEEGEFPRELIGKMAESGYFAVLTSKDSGLLSIGEGTSEVQREIIARRLLGER